MNLHFKPIAGKASAEAKKKWFMYEMLRYYKSISLMSRIQTLISIILFSAIIFFVHNLLLAFISATLMLVGMEYLFLFIHIKSHTPFYAELTECLFGEDYDSSHDMRLILNRVGNLVELKDPKLRDKVYGEMVECYQRLKTKEDLREALVK